METTVGKLLVNAILPPDLRTDDVLDSKRTKKLLNDLAQRYPERYAEIASKLLNLGAEISYRSGGPALRYEHFRPSDASLRVRQKIIAEINNVLVDPSLTPQQKNEKIIAITSDYDQKLMDEVMDELKRGNNTFYAYHISGARGNKVQVRRIVSGDMLYVDHRNRVIPIPVLKSFSEGLDPAEYWASTYGARKGWADTNLGTAKAGYLSKQLANAASRLIITAVDAPNPWPQPRGLPVPTDDMNNIGAFLAMDTDGYKRNTLLTPTVLNDLKAKGFDKILIRSAVVSLSPDGGLLARDVGTMEGGRMLVPGDAIGIIASQSVGEPITQMVISSKHTGGVKSQHYADVSVLNRILQVPIIFPGGAVHATKTGYVTKIEPNPAGGHFIYIDNEPHYVGTSAQILVKPGQFVEAGDPMTDGVPNPTKIVQYKGLGEGRAFLTNLLYDWYRKSGFSVVRRNFEILAAALLNHVRLLQEFQGFLPGDIVNYSWLERNWRPREGAKLVSVDHAVGKFLELPVLHYTIGTKILPSFVKTLKEFGIKEVLVHDEPPPFEPIMVPAERLLNIEPDWLTRFLGGTLGQKRSLLKAVQEGQVSKIYDTSFVPALVIGTPFAKDWPQRIIRKG